MMPTESKVAKVCFEIKASSDGMKLKSGASNWASTDSPTAPSAPDVYTYTNASSATADIEYDNVAGFDDATVLTPGVTLEDINSSWYPQTISSGGSNTSSSDESASRLPRY